MAHALIILAIVVIVVGLICWLITLLIDMLPLPAPFGQVAKVLIVVAGILIILLKALPLLDVSLP